MNENSSEKGKGPAGQEEGRVWGVSYEVTLPDGTKEWKSQIFKPEDLPVVFLESLVDEGIRVLLADLRRRKLETEADLVNDLVFLLFAASRKRRGKLTNRDRLSVIECLASAVGEMEKLGWRMGN